MKHVRKPYSYEHLSKTVSAYLEIDNLAVDVNVVYH
jgi:hypothetical protein